MAQPYNSNTNIAMETERKYVIGIGEALWDVLPEGKKIGGAPANFAYHVSQFGLESLVVSAVGEDALGEEILANFREKNLQCIVPKVAFPTGTVQVTVDAAGVPSYDIRQDVAWDNIPFTEELRRLAGQTCAVCFGSLAQRSRVSRNAIHSFLDAMPGGDGVYRIFDINLRQSFYSRETVCDSLSRCNILKINDEELATVSRMFGFREADMQKNCRKLLDEYSLEMVILTCGVNGSYVFTPEAMSFAATPEVQVADTVGAGDSFTAGFIAGLLKGLSVQESHHLAADVSAYVCTQSGAMPELPETLIRLAE